MTRHLYITAGIDKQKMRDHAAQLVAEGEEVEIHYEPYTKRVSESIDRLEAKPFTVPPRHELLWIGVDLDNTLAHGVWPEVGIGEPLRENVAKLQELVDNGYKIIIYTARGWEDVELVEKWLEHHDIPYNRVICGKVLLRAMVDDKNILPEEESWLPL